MSSRYSPPAPLEIVLGFSTSDATPYTPPELRLTLTPGGAYLVRVRGAAKAADGSAAIFEFDARQTWIRTAGGVSSRVGTSAGQQTNVGNTFPAPANTRPKVTFADPAATHHAWSEFIGRAGVAINWTVTARIEEVL